MNITYSAGVTKPANRFSPGDVLRYSELCLVLERKDDHSSDIWLAGLNSGTLFRVSGATCFEVLYYEVVPVK
jgi:hypothetical protein